MQILLMDEVSMVDIDCWQKILEVLAIAQQTRRPTGQPQDNIGDLHLVLFGHLTVHLNRACMLLAHMRRIRNLFVLAQVILNS